MSKLIMLVGLPASGKTTLANSLKESENAEIVSSDVIREELFKDENFQGDNTQVFNTVNKRIKDFLLKGKTVIYDATNINRKRRIHAIQNEFKVGKYEVYYMNKHVSDCIRDDVTRDRTVGEDVISRMYKNLHIPTKNEGWDKVTFYNSKGNSIHGAQLKHLINKEDIGYDDLFNELGKIMDEFQEIKDVSQDSSYHSFSISRHIYHVVEYIKSISSKYDGKHYDELLMSSLFHDLGKGVCKSFYNHRGEIKRYASFIGHENVSAQLAAYYLSNFNYNEKFIKYVVDLVQFHMMPMNLNHKLEKRLKTLTSIELYNDLMLLHEADKNAR